MINHAACHPVRKIIETDLVTATKVLTGGGQLGINLEAKLASFYLRSHRDPTIVAPGDLDIWHNLIPPGCMRQSRRGYALI